LKFTLVSYAYTCYIHKCVCVPHKCVCVPHKCVCVAHKCVCVPHKCVCVPQCVLLINLRMHALECAGNGRKAVSCWRPLSLLPPEIHGAIRHCSRCLDGLLRSDSCTSTVYRNKLQHIATHVLPTATSCTSTAYRNKLQHIATHVLPTATSCTSTAYRNTSQHIATHCNALQHMARYCST